jgi:bifunctional non-homologous end joining protein LigD
MPRPTKKTSGLAEYNRKRDFARTPEPTGSVRPRAAGKPLVFVIQKHAATALHYDLRLEVDGVMKSWAVPKGPSLDPSVRRLAMEVEDHPMDYNTFEGTIPKGEYGGGTVLLWDHGTYFADEAGDEDQEAVLAREHEAGKISFTVEGERLQGSFALIRTDRGEKPKWLLIKHRDGHVDTSEDVTERWDTSVVTGRTLDEIAEEEDTEGFRQAGIEPMRYQDAYELPSGDTWVYRPFLGGRRVHAYVTPESHTLVTGHAGEGDFSEIAEELQKLSRRVGASFVLDGEVSSDDREQKLHVFDLLFEEGDILLSERWRDRRDALEALFSRRRVTHVALVPIRRRGGPSLLEKAKDEGWAGVVAVRTDSIYRAGERTGDWVRVRV